MSLKVLSTFVLISNTERIIHFVGKGVRAYKWTSEGQKVEVGKILNWDDHPPSAPTPTTTSTEAATATGQAAEKNIKGKKFRFLLLTLQWNKYLVDVWLVLFTARQCATTLMGTLCR